MYEDFRPVYPGKSQPNFVADVAAGGQETDCEIAGLYFTIRSRRGETRQVLYSIENKQIFGLAHASSSVSLVCSLSPPPPTPALHFILIHSCAPKTAHKLEVRGRIWAVRRAPRRECSAMAKRKRPAEQSWLRAPVSLEQRFLLFQGALTITASKATAHQFLLSAQVRLPVDWPSFLIYFLFPLAEQRKP